MKALSLLLLSICAINAVAQTAPARTAGETIEVSIVNVDVVVTDRNGNHVRGLTANDFVIREGGEVRPITNFTAYGDSASPAGAAGAAVRAEKDVPEKRTILIVVDFLELPPHAAEPTFDALRQFVRRTVRPGDAAAIYSWTASRTLLRHGYSDDVASLTAVLTNLERESTGWRNTYALRSGETIDAPHVFFDAVRGDEHPDAYATRFLAESDSEYELWSMRRKAHSLNALMQTMSGVDGRKIVLFAADRFGLNASPYQVTTAGWRRGRLPATLFDTRELRESVMRTANAYDIALYPVYPLGMQSSSRVHAAASGRDVVAGSRQRDLARFTADNERLLNQTASLDELADVTGGRMAWSGKGVAELLPRVADDLETYYSLAYRAASSGKADVRSLEVRTTNRNYRVQARRQAVEQTAFAKMQDRVITNLYRDLHNDTIPIVATAGMLRAAGERKTVIPVSVAIPVGSLTTRADGTGAFTVFVAAGGPVGVVSDVVQRSETFGSGRVHAVEEFSYDFELQIDPLAERISIGVLDEVSGEFGLHVIDLGASSGMGSETLTMP